MESFSKFKDTLLYSISGLLVGILITLSTTILMAVLSMKESIVKLEAAQTQEAKEREEIKKRVAETENKNQEQEKEIIHIKAILKEDEKKNIGNIAERQTE